MEIVVILHASIHSMTPLLLAGTGELVSEKSGVLNLGIEGMMLMGAVSAFIVTMITDSALLGFLVAMLFGAGMASIFAFMTISLAANQIVSGLALTMLGIGMSAFIGMEYEGIPLFGVGPLYFPYLSDIPILGKLLFQHDILVYLAFLILFATHYFLFHTHYGLVLRAVGENHDAAYKMGYSVVKIRYLAVLFGGVMSGLAGAYLSLIYTPLWVESMTAGRGWIVLALVVFSVWMPWRLLLGAWLFGFVSIVQLFMQDDSTMLRHMPTEFFSMLPYLTTIIALIVISKSKNKRFSKNRAPADLGNPFISR